jgi:hypothetical protein
MWRFILSCVIEAAIGTALFVLLAMTVIACARQVKWHVGD